MDNLPTPLSRIELYLAAAAQMPGVTMPEEPLSRLEQYLAFIAGDTSVELPTPASLCEEWLAYVAGITPAEPLALEGAFHVGVQKVDVRFFAAAAGMPGVIAPEPQNRTEQFWAKLAEILPVHGTLKYATGTNLTLTDVAWWRMGLERINGDTTQQTYTGKNIYNATTESTTTNSVTFSADNAELYMNGTSTGGVSLKFANMSLPAGTYTMTLELVGGSITTTSTGAIFYVQGTNVTNSPGQDLLRPDKTQASTVVTVSADTTNAHIECYARTSETFTNAVIKYQIVAGSDADYDFEPYVGGVPAPNPDYPQAINTVTGEQTVTVASPNLLTGTVDFSGDWERDTYWTTEPETYNGLTVKSRKAGWSGIYKAFAVKSGETYTFSVYAKAGSNRTSRIYLGSPGGAEVTSPTRLDISITTEWQRFSVTFTTTADGTIAPRVENTAAQSTPTYICGYQLQTGATATDFQPYQKTEYKINLGDIELCNILSGYGKSSQDYIYKNGKDWYIHYENAKVALDGSEGWAANSGVFYSWPKTDTKASIFAMASYTSLVADCTHFNKRGYDANVQGSFYSGSSNVNFNWDNSHNNLASFKTWLSNNNVLFYGQRKTAIEIKITNPTLISQLNALDRAVLPQPIAYITASGDLTGELKISYYGEEE